MYIYERFSRLNCIKKKLDIFPIVERHMEISLLYIFIGTYLVGFIIVLIGIHFPTLGVRPIITKRLIAI